MLNDVVVVVVVDGDDIAVVLVVLVVQVFNVDVVEQIADHRVWYILKKQKHKGGE